VSGLEVLGSPGNTDGRDVRISGSTRIDPDMSPFD
jgi:hypothetical protein